MVNKNTEKAPSSCAKPTLQETAFFGSSGMNLFRKVQPLKVHSESSNSAKGGSNEVNHVCCHCLSCSLSLFGDCIVDSSQECCVCQHLAKDQRCKVRCQATTESSKVKVRDTDQGTVASPIQTQTKLQKHPANQHEHAFVLFSKTSTKQFYQLEEEIKWSGTWWEKFGASKTIFSHLLICLTCRSSLQQKEWPCAPLFRCVFHRLEGLLHRLGDLFEVHFSG